jgi:hypothetical protein
MPEALTAAKITLIELGALSWCFEGCLVGEADVICGGEAVHARAGACTWLPRIRIPGIYALWADVVPGSCIMAAVIRSLSGEECDPYE